MTPESFVKVSDCKESRKVQQQTNLLDYNRRPMQNRWASKAAFRHKRKIVQRSELGKVLTSHTLTSRLGQKFPEDNNLCGKSKPLTILDNWLTDQSEHVRGNSGIWHFKNLNRFLLSADIPDVMIRWPMAEDRAFRYGCDAWHLLRN